MGSAVDAGRRLAELVTDCPERAALLARLGIDLCRHGGQALREACWEAGLDPDQVCRELGDVPVRPAAGDWGELEPRELVRHIVETHHRYLHDELGQLEALATEVEARHGGDHPELGELRSLLLALRLEMESHLDEEERVLFPGIVAGEGVEAALPVLAAHDRITDRLRRLREVTGGYQVPARAPASWRSLYERLVCLELDTYLHVHKEGNVLLPRVLGEAAGSG